MRSIPSDLHTYIHTAPPSFILVVIYGRNVFCLGDSGLALFHASMAGDGCVRRGAVMREEEPSISEAYKRPTCTQCCLLYVAFFAYDAAPCP